MATVTFINFNELKFKHKRTQNNDHGKSRNVIRDPHTRLAVKGTGRLSHETDTGDLGNALHKSSDFNQDPHTRFSDERMEMFSHERDLNDLYSALRPFLIFGKFIGLIPIQGLFQRDVDKLTFNKSSFPALINVIISGIISVNVIMSFVGLSREDHKNAGGYAWAPAILLFYSLGLFAYVYFYRHAWGYIHVLRKWNKMNLTFSKPDKTLCRDVNLMAFFVMTSAVFENLLFTFNQFQIVPVTKDSLTSTHLNEEQNASALEIYYIRSHKNWASLFPFHPLAAVFVFVSNKIAVYAWNYLDLTIAFMSRALYHKFRALYLQGEAILICTCSGYDPLKWRQLTHDLQVLTSMLDDIAAGLSPMIFCSFGMNVYAVCIQLHLGLTPSPNRTLLESIYTVWAILHLVTRVYLITLCATRINDWAHRLSVIFRKCPNQAYTIEVERAARFVSLNTIGLNGLSCFIVTKPLLLQLAGSVLTFEIVLLQFSQTSLTQPVCQCSSYKT